MLKIMISKNILHYFICCKRKFVINTDKLKNQKINNPNAEHTGCSVQSERNFVFKCVFLFISNN